MGAPGWRVPARGGDPTLDVDVRVIAATNRNLEKKRWARVFPGQNGTSVVIVTDQPICFPSDYSDDARSATGLGVIQLEGKRPRAGSR